MTMLVIVGDKNRCAFLEKVETKTVGTVGGVALQRARKAAAKTINQYDWYLRIV